MLRSKINGQIPTSCFSGVGEKKLTTNCYGEIIKYGRTKGGKQRYLCKTCGKLFLKEIEQNGYKNKFDFQIIQLKKEGLGIRSIARVLRISPATVIRKILQIAEQIDLPKILNQLGRIQVDELHTFIQNKDREVYVIYSWDQESKQALSLAVGTRSKTNLRLVVNPLLAAGVESINTDRYSGYKGVVPKKLHTTFKRRNNGIERQNLNLRTHLKRLDRRTICYSKSLTMLLAVVKIHFWFGPQAII